MTRGAASSSDLLQAKAALRREVIARRDAADGEMRNLASQAIIKKLLDLPAYRAARTVAAYASFGSELGTSTFIAKALADGKQLLLPRINRAQRALELRHVLDPATDLVPGVWGICEPSEHCELVSVAAIDFMLVPGVAFMTNGARLGYGGGFYDRLLASLDRRTARIAAAFQLQIVEQLPEGPHDQRVHVVVAEN
jgi:5,10-methenyltetrahydrofolate synthetase